MLLRAGRIPEDASTELLNGLIVHTDRSTQGEDPLRVGKGHRICVERLSDLRSKINSAARHVETQQPLICAETHVPEPDFMILRGTLEDYSDLPIAVDAYCVMEVADSSYERDAGEKLAGYAQAGVQQYIIINLRTRSADVFTNPDIASGTYPPPKKVAADGELELHMNDGERHRVRLESLLP